MSSAIHNSEISRSNSLEREVCLGEIFGIIFIHAINLLLKGLENNRAEGVARDHSELYPLVRRVFGNNPNSASNFGKIGVVCIQDPLTKEMVCRYTQSDFSEPRNGSIYWIECQSTDTVKSSFSKIAHEHGITHDERTTSAGLASRVYDQFRSQNSGVLLIFNDFPRLRGPVNVFDILHCFPDYTHPQQYYPSVLVVPEQSFKLKDPELYNEFVGIFPHVFHVEVDKAPYDSTGHAYEKQDERTLAKAICNTENPDPFEVLYPSANCMEDVQREWSKVGHKLQESVVGSACNCQVVENIGAITYMSRIARIERVLNGRESLSLLRQLCCQQGAADSHRNCPPTGEFVSKIRLSSLRQAVLKQLCKELENLREFSMVQYHSDNKNITVRVPEVVWGFVISGVGNSFMAKSFSSMPQQLLTCAKVHDPVQKTVYKIKRVKNFNKNTGIKAKKIKAAGNVNAVAPSTKKSSMPINFEAMTKSPVTDEGHVSSATPSGTGSRKRKLSSSAPSSKEILKMKRCSSAASLTSAVEKYTQTDEMQSVDTHELEEDPVLDAIETKIIATLRQLPPEQRKTILETIIVFLGPAFND